MKLTSIQRAVSTALVGASAVLVAVAGAAAAAGSGPRLERMCLGDTIDEDCQVGPPSGTTDGHGSTDAGNADLAAANMAAAMYQDIEQAEAAGYVSTLETLGCFEDPQLGGMGLHYANEALTDANLDAARHPKHCSTSSTTEATSRPSSPTSTSCQSMCGPAAEPPRLFGRDFHRHPVLPVWILHTWIWKDNPAGVFADFNPRVRPCPDGVPVFGDDASPSGFRVRPIGSARPHRTGHARDSAARRAVGRRDS